MSDELRDRVELVVRLPAELHEALKARAEVEDRSMAAVIRVALRQYVADQDHRVLWEGATGPLYQHDTPLAWLREDASSIPVAPGTVVAVVSRDNQNDTTEERQQ